MGIFLDHGVPFPSFPGILFFQPVVFLNIQFIALPTVKGRKA